MWRTAWKGEGGRKWEAATIEDKSSCPQRSRVIHKVIHMVLHEAYRELSTNPPALLLQLVYLIYISDSYK